MVAPGTYQMARVVGSVLGKTSTGKEQIAVTFEVPDGQNQRITWYGYFTEAAWPGTEQALKNLGWDAAEHDYRFDLLNGTDALVGSLADVVIEEQTYANNQGQDIITTKVRWVNKPGGGSGGGVKEQMTTDEAVDFSQRIRGRLIAAKGPQANRAPGASKPKPAAAQPEKTGDWTGSLTRVGESPPTGEGAMAFLFYGADGQIFRTSDHALAISTRELMNQGQAVDIKYREVAGMRWFVEVNEAIPF